MTPSKLFKIALLATLAVKLALAAMLPMSGDEAYLAVSAKHLDFGYYDYPPLAGWILHLLLYLGSSQVLLRLPAILLGTVIAIGIYRLLKPQDEVKAALLASLFLIAPINILDVLVAADTPLILFVFLSGTALFQALKQNSLKWYGWSGIFLGLAFLSNYFAVLLIPAYLAYFVFSEQGTALSRNDKTRGFVRLFLAALPFALVSLCWNYTHCWAHIQSNPFTNNGGGRFSLGKLAVFFGAQIYLITPPIIYYLYKHRAELKQKYQTDDFKLFAWLFLVPVTVFALLSLIGVIGLNWMLAFYPFLYLLLWLLLSREELLKSFKFMVWFSAAHLALLAIIVVLPLETWKHSKLYEDIVFMFDNDKVADKIRPYEQQDFAIAAEDYTSAAIASYHAGKDVIVFGEGSRSARQDDLLTDFRSINGRNMLILKNTAPDLMKYLPYFESVESKQFELHGTTYYFVLGYSFDYASYKDSVLKPVKEKYYNIPAYLPHAPCYFCVKYFSEDGV